ncbi:MAG: hypothetical protein LW824_19565 [Algoriphagus sp.]|nr:hypothetical protein [Algoriphagus sp.]MCE2779772.1 hypothetical protein [Algoriphagus sp.]
MNFLNTIFFRTNFMHPSPREFRLVIIFFLIGNLFLISCVQEAEVPTAIRSESGQLAKIKAWFEENESKLRLSDGGTNLRMASQELILPFFEKEPDWDQFHHYYFPDGREVFEISLANATKYFPTTMLDSFPNRNPAEVVIQNILFIKHPTEERFDPVIARYYPDNKHASKKFQEISYDGIPHDWSGKVDIWTYDERHFIGFTFEQGELVSNSRYLPAGSSEKSRIAGDCRTLIREISANYVGKDGVVVVRPPIVIVEVICSGAGGYTPQGGNGGVYHDYDRPTCCEDPITAPPRDLPDYDPPKIPAPDTIINKLTDPCASDIFRELSKRNEYLTDGVSNFGGLDIFPGMLDLFKKSGKFDYQIQNKDLTFSLGGNTSPIVDGVITITLSNTYLKSATSLSIARTIIHETVHAYLRKQTNPHTANDINMNQLLIEFGKKYPNSIGNTHHSLMSQYILGMAISLYNWDKKYGPNGGSLGFDYYYKMAFGGLIKEGTSEFVDEAKNLVPLGSSLSEIRKIIENEAMGNYEANGKRCN